ncbi:MAG: magnesium chelatase subunit D [Oceanicaulis sp.]
MTETAHTPRGWAQARLAAALLAIDPGLGGAVLTARAGPARDAWLDYFRSLLNDDTPWRRIPASVNDEALLGGIDLTATLKAGKPVRRAGLLEQIGRYGVGVLAMAERAEAGLAGRLAAALEGAAPPLIVALDESADPDEAPPAALAERLALQIDLSEVSLGELDAAGPGPEIEDVAMAQVRLPHILNGEAGRALTETAAALGIVSLRAPLMALRAARAAAALAGRDEIAQDDAALAARLVLAPRARQIPQAPEPENPESDEDRAPDDETADSQDEAPDREAESDETDEDALAPDELTEITLEAAAASIPEGLLLKLQAGAAPTRSAGAGRAGAVRKDGLRGRPAGVRRGDPVAGQRLDILATLRAAAPWGKVRRTGLKRFLPGQPIEVRREDFRIKRFKPKAETVTVFIVDASGSLALNRLAEAKGAVELMLAESYVRRDQVALIAFRGPGAETLLPPTRSLTRAKRSLAALPGGGGTPLAAAIEAAEMMAHSSARQGRSVTLVFLTDGAANIARDGTPGRETAQAEAVEAARRLRASGCSALVVDMSRRGAETAKTLAGEMAARYVRLPVADPGALADLARKAAA